MKSPIIFFSFFENGLDHVNFLGRLLFNKGVFTSSLLPSLREPVMQTQLPVQQHSPTFTCGLSSAAWAWRALPTLPPAQSEGCWRKSSGPLSSEFFKSLSRPRRSSSRKGEAAALPLSPCSSYTRDSHTGTESRVLAVQLSSARVRVLVAPGQLFGPVRGPGPPGLGAVACARGPARPPGH